MNSQLGLSDFIKKGSQQLTSQTKSALRTLTTGQLKPETLCVVVDALFAMKTEVFERRARAAEDLLGLRVWRLCERALGEVLGRCVGADPTDSEDSEGVGDKTPVQQGCHCST